MPSLLCLATAVCYAEMAKLYPGTGSSYYFAEQSFLNHEEHWKLARLAKFIVGWGSHLYYWIYPGVMVAVMGVLCGYLAGTIWPNFMNSTNPGPVFMMLIAVVFSFAVAYIAQRGVNGATSVNIAINVIQITALVVFSVLALGYRMNHPPGSEAWQFDSQSGDAYTYEFATTKTIVDGKPTDTIVRDKDGVPQPQKDASGKPVPFKISYPAADEKGVFLSHSDAASVVSPHNFSWVFIQATVAILILVGFESVTAMGGEAKNPKRDVPIAVITSLLVQGAFCYLFEYFAANYFLNNGYPMTSASGSAAPIGDMMIVVGNAILGPGNGRIFMEIEAFTVFLALIGTTLSCINTGARVTYAMGKDQEVPEHFGILHDENLTPHRAIWALAIISAVIGCLAVIMPFGDANAPTDAAIKALPQGFFSSFGYTSHDGMAALPNSLLDHHPGFQFRNLPSLYVELHYMHCCLHTEDAAVQYGKAQNHSGVRPACQPGLHGLLSGRTLHGLRNQDGAITRARYRCRVGYLRRHLLLQFQQSHWQNYVGQEPRRRSKPLSY